MMLCTCAGFYDHMMIGEMLEECNKMCNLNHPNVLSLIGVCLDGGTAPYIVMPFMANSSLLSYLKKRRHELIVPPGHEQDVSCIQPSQELSYSSFAEIQKP